MFSFIARSKVSAIQTRFHFLIRKRNIHISVLLLFFCCSIIVGCTASNQPKSSRTQPLDEILYACNITPKFRYHNQLFSWDKGSVKQNELPSEWSLTGIISGASSEGVLQELQANSSDMVGCEIWETPTNAGTVYLKKGDVFCLFVSEFFQCEWIFHNGFLYLYEDRYSHYFSDQVTTQNTSSIPDNTVLLGMSVYEDKYQLPTGELHTNAVTLRGYEIYCDPNDDTILYVAIPNGLKIENQKVTRYDRYFKVDITKLMN